MLDRHSPYSLYDTSIGGFTMGADYNQKDAEGFINILGLPVKIGGAKTQAPRSPLGAKEEEMKLWGGRFARQRDRAFEKFSESFSVDQRLIHYDLRVNVAYVRELGRARVLTRGEVRRLRRGLEAIRRYVEAHPHWASGAAAKTFTPGWKRAWKNTRGRWRESSAPAAAATIWWRPRLGSS